MVTLVIEFDAFTDKTDYRNAVESFEHVVVRFLVVFVVDVEFKLSGFLVPVIVRDFNPFRVRIVFYVSAEESPSVLQRVCLVAVETEWHDVKYYNVGGVTECRVVPVEHNIACVDWVDERLPVLYTDSEKSVTVIEHVSVRVHEHRVESCVYPELTEVIALRTERGTRQLAHEGYDVGLDVIDDNERVIANHRPFGIVVVGLS